MRRSAFVAASLVSALALLPTPGARAATVTVQGAAATATSDTVTVTWHDATAGADDHLVVLHDGAGAWRATVQCGPSCRSATFRGLPASSRFTASVTAASGGAWAPWARTAAVTTLADPSCAGVATACVGVDATRTAGPVTRVGQGFQLGLDARTDQRRVAELAPRMWRMPARDAARFTAARATGARVTVMLSGPWYDTTRDRLQAPCLTCWGGADAPWSDWARYRAFVTETVRWHVDNGLLPDYWDIQNEPDAREYYDRTAPYSQALVFEQFRVAHDAIRAVLPDARIVGPSTSVLRPGAFGARVDLGAFLDFAESAGLRIDAVSFHDIGNGDAVPTLQGGPAGTRSRIETVRALLAAHPGLGSPEIHVNEWGAEWNRRQPAATVGYVAALEAEGVTYANRTCWDAHECFNSPGTIGGILLGDGATPTATGLVHRAYQAMTGDRLPATVTDRAASVHATLGNGVVRVLLGRHQGCVANLDACAATAVSSAPTTLAVRVGDGALWRVVVERIAHTGGGGTQQVVLDQILRPASGVVRVPAFPVADADAYVVTLTRR